MFDTQRLGYGDANKDPKEFTIAPGLPIIQFLTSDNCVADAIPRVLKSCKLTIEDVSLFEINEAFSVVVLANEKVNWSGGLVPTVVNLDSGLGSF